MPQSTGKLSSKNSFHNINFTERRLRTGNLRQRLANISLTNQAKQETEAILNSKYRNHADRTYEINSLKKDSQILIHQVALTKESGVQWRNMVKSHSFIDGSLTAKNSPITPDSEALVNRLNIPNLSPVKSARATKSAAVGGVRSRSGSIAIDQYTKSYRHLKDMMDADSSMRSNMQYKSDIRRTELMNQYTKSDANLQVRIQKFLTDVDLMIANDKQKIIFPPKNECFRTKDDEFINSLKNLDFSILLS